MPRHLTHLRLIYRRGGFSLIEVTIVILVLGILAAVAAPRFSQALRLTKLEAAARQLAAHIEYLRNTAANEGRSVSLFCDNDLHTYESDSVDFPERMGERLRVSIPQDYDPSFTLSADFDSQSSLTFDFEGVPRVGGAAMSDGIIVLAAGNDQFSVIIASGTGAARVQRTQPRGGDGGDDVDVEVEPEGVEPGEFEAGEVEGIGGESGGAEPGGLFGSLPKAIGATT